MPDLLRDQLQESLGPAYTLEHELGGGGMSRVFVAHDQALGREVVVKVLEPGLAAGLSAERFEREIRLAARLQEPHIVPVLSAGVTRDGLPFYTMPFVRGESLRTRLARGPVPLGEAVGILRDVTRALAYAHRQGVVHRDVKPENVLLSEGTAVVTDLGIAKAVDVSTTQARAGAAGGAVGGTLTAVGMTVGTPAYMSPEQVVGDRVDPRADLYAWGVVAYELLAGSHPFADRQTTPQLVAAHLTEVPPLSALRTANVPEPLTTLVMRCLEKEPARRPRTAEELAVVLDALAVPNGAVAPHRGATATPARRMLTSLAAVLVLAAAAAATWLWTTRATDDAAIRSLAVLPFENVGGDSADAYLAHGLTDELTMTLGKLQDFRVAPGVSSRVLHRRRLTAPDIARTLGVEAVLAGTVRRGGDRLRVAVELVDGSGGERLWSEQFEAAPGDVFAVQDQVTRAIVSALRLRLAGGVTPTLGAARETVDPEAYDLYLRGRYFWSLRSENGIRRAVEYFRDAVARDSNYVPAISGLADAYAVSGFYSYVPPTEGFGRAKLLARRALALDSTRAEPHASLGYVALYHDWSWPEAERQFRRAIELDSSYATAHQWYGNYHVAMNHADEALESLGRAQRADPLNRIAVGAVCWGLYMLRKYADAVAQCDRAIELDSTFALARLWRGQASARLGDTAVALRDLDAAVTLSGRSAVALAALAQAHAAAGQPDRARLLLEELTAERDRYLPSYEVGLVHAALGDRKRAMDWLERAYEERSHSIVFLRVDPALDALRAERRFVALLGRAELR